MCSVLCIYLSSHPTFGGTSFKEKVQSISFKFAIDLATFQVAESNKLWSFISSLEKKKKSWQLKAPVVFIHLWASAMQCSDQYTSYEEKCSKRHSYLEIFRWDSTVIWDGRKCFRKRNSRPFSVNYSWKGNLSNAFSNWWKVWGEGKRMKDTKLVLKPSGINLNRNASCYVCNMGTKGH